MSPGPQKKFDREKVLEKAMQLFWKNGYEATGMTLLLEHIGIGRQSLYDTFGDKRTLFLETLDHYFRTRVGPILAQLRAPGPAMDNLRKVFRMWQEMDESGDFCGCLVGNTTAEMGHNHPDVAERLAVYLRTLEDAMTETLTRAQEEGELAAGHDPRGVARTMIHTVHGVALLSKVFRDGGMARGVMKSALDMIGVS